MEKRNNTKKAIILLGAIFMIIVIIFVAATIWAVLANNGDYTGFLRTKQFWLVLSVCVACILIFVLSNLRANYGKKVLKNNRLEDSHWMTTKEMQDAPDITSITFDKLHTVSDGIPFAADYLSRRKNNLLVRIMQCYHTLVVGTTRSGKTSGFIEPMIQILARTKSKPSMVISDPKGELYETHAQALKDQGYKISLIDLKDVYRSSKWNPFFEVVQLTNKILENTGETAKLKIGSERGKYFYDNKAFLTYEEAENEQQILVQSLNDEIFRILKDITYDICPITSKADTGWQEGARELVFALTLALWEDYRDGFIREEQLSLYNIYKSIDLYCNADIEILREYFNNRDFFSKTRGLSDTVLVTVEKTLSSYLTDVKKYFSWMADMGLASLTSQNELDFSTFDDEATVLFLRIPDTDETRYKIVALLLNQLYKQLVKKGEDNTLKGKTTKGRLLRNVYYILDEFGNIPKIQSFARIAAVGAGRGIICVPVIQDYAQLDMIYGKDEATIIRNNCNIKVFIGSADDATKQAFSNACGKQKIRGLSYSQSKDVSISTTAQERPLITVSEINEINTATNMGNALVLSLYKPPIRTKFVQSYKIPKIYGLKSTSLPKRPAEVFKEERFFFDIAKRAEFFDKSRAVLSKKPKKIDMVTEPTVVEELKISETELLSAKLESMLAALLNKVEEDKLVKLLVANISEKLLLIDEYIDDAASSRNMSLQFELTKIKVFINTNFSANADMTQKVS